MIFLKKSRCVLCGTSLIIKLISEPLVSNAFKIFDRRIIVLPQSGSSELNSRVRLSIISTSEIQPNTNHSFLLGDKSSVTNKLCNKYRIASDCSGPNKILDIFKLVHAGLE